MLLGTLCFGSVAAERGDITEDLQWELSDVGTLIITGSGEAIPDYSAQSSAPWAAYAKQIKDLSLPGDLKSIGAYAFYGCSNLRAARLNQITSVGAFAFCGCANLSDVELSNKIQTFGEAAFAESGLKSVALPYSLKEIPDKCFWNCTELHSVCFKEVTSSIGVFVKKDGAERIGQEAFEFCTALTEVYTIHNNEREENLPSTLKQVGTKAFSACVSLQTIAFAPKSELTLGEAAFSDCESLQSCTLPEKNIFEIPKECFMLTALHSVYLPESISAVGEDAFAFCDSLSKIDVFNNACTFFAGENTIPDQTVLWVVYSANNPIMQYAENFGKQVKVLCNVERSQTHLYKDTVTRKASALQSGILEQKCGSCGYVKKTSAIAKVANVKLTKTSFYYTGKVICPTAAQVLITDANGKQIPSTEYTVTCQTGGKAVGKHSVKIAFKSTCKNYRGSFVRYYTIVLKGTKVTSVDSGAGKLRVHWSKQTTGTDGYQVRLCKNKNFKSGVILKTVRDKKATALLIKSLSRKTGYYIEVRTFQTIGKNKYNFSAWSAPYGRKTK